MFEAGSVVSGYRVDARLGGGASAVVYRVHPVGQATQLAMKVLRTEAASHAKARERFAREFGIASLLHHPHIVAVYAKGEIPAEPPACPTLWMTTQYVDGPDSAVLVPAPSAQPDVAVILLVAKQIAAALDYAHSVDVLHRDVKPANILLSADHRFAYLTDFGIAQLIDDVKPLASNGRVRGSIAYAAPELLQAQQLSRATDLYALACTMFEWLTGAPPFPRSTTFAITYAHLHDPAPRLTRRRPWLPGSLDAVFAKGLAKNAGARYGSCAEFVDIVTRTLRDVPVPEAFPHRRTGRP
ncbi:MAG: serine/threonine protein kinase [Mycolicibacterium cosmeticum]|nr:serine/threonine protein kinase [Mycolicibacterium cosmeticum]